MSDELSPPPVEKLAPVRLPQGVRDYLPRAAARRRNIADAILDECERWGYRRIITPAFEYEAVLARGLGRKARAETVRFVEPSTGEVVALRPDITPQVARLVATRLAAEPGPIRLGYEGSVVRLGLSATGQRELFQAGAELVDGIEPIRGPGADVEVIALAAAALAAAGLARVTLDVGEVSVVRAALAGLDGDVGAALERAVARKDQHEVERQAQALGLPAARRKLVAALPSLYGDPSVIERAQSLVPRGDRTTHAGLTTLSTVVGRLQRLGHHVTVDLGEVRGFDYYTGVRFQGFAPGVGDALLSGGRYDRLIERYGTARRRAAGFAVDVEKVATALRDQGAGNPATAPAAGVLVAGEPELAASLAAALRRAGGRAVAQLDDRVASDETLRAQADREGLARVLIATGRGGRWLGGRKLASGLLRRVLDGDAAATLDLLGETGSSG